MFRVINRVKEIKDLILIHLQRIYDATQVSQENEASLLSGSKHTIETLQQLRQQMQQQNTELLQQIQYLQELQQDSRDALLSTNSLIKPQSVNSNRVGLNPETALIAYLYPYLPNHAVLDIGANVGEFSEQLLKAGYEVYAFEPFSSVFNQLKEQLGSNSNFHAYEVAIGATDGNMDLHLVTCHANKSQYDAPTVYSSLRPHAMPKDLSFSDKVQVAVRSLESLHRSQEIPAEVALVKIDTEGFDLEVIRGMGDSNYPVVITEFWDRQHVFQESGALDDLVKALRPRNYHWYIVICRDSDTAEVSYYCNYDQTPARSWGNVFFFQDYDLFTHALKWCAAMLPPTYLIR